MKVRQTYSHVYRYISIRSAKAQWKWYNITNVINGLVYRGPMYKNSYEELRRKLSESQEKSLRYAKLRNSQLQPRKQFDDINNYVKLRYFPGNRAQDCKELNLQENIILQ